MALTTPHALRRDTTAPRHTESREDLASRLQTIEAEALLARSGGATVMRVDEVLHLVNGPLYLPRGA